MHKNDKFDLAWRFTEEKYNKLPQDELDKIFILPSSEAWVLWSKYVSREFDHILKLPKSNEEKEVIFTVDWNKEDKARKIISKNINVKDSEKIIFFWSSKCAVETNWGIFIKYWSDFCYPDDDNTVLVIPSVGQTIFYCEERFFINKIQKSIA
jgi:hypothetical protein